jgi:repressor LexA
MKNLVVVRNQKGLTQQELADQVGVTRTTIANYESGLRDPSTPIVRKIAEVLGVTTDFLLETELSSQSVTVFRIPVLGEVPAGQPIEAFEHVEEYIDLYPSFAKYGELFGLRVKGNSMEPNILSGDIAVVLKQDYCDSGDVAVVRVNATEVTVKQVKKQANGILLIPCNQSFETVFFTNEQIQQLPVTIIGKIIEIRRRL